MLPAAAAPALLPLGLKRRLLRRQLPRRGRGALLRVRLCRREVALEVGRLLLQQQRLAARGALGGL